MGEYKTPGVYIKETNAFGTSVVEAETAIPAFIGITEKALNGTEDLKGKPWKISSMTEFYNYFGGAPNLEFTVDVKKFNYLSPKQVQENKELAGGTPEPTEGLFVYADRLGKETEEVKVKVQGATDDGSPEQVRVGYAFCVDGKHPYSLYYNMVMFFANGGGTCYIVSVGTYDDGNTGIDDGMVENALIALTLEREVTMIVVPEAASSGQRPNIQQKMMKHCGEMGNRIAILDVPLKTSNDPLDKRMENFQNTVTGYFAYGAAYYPWLNTSVLSERDLDGSMFSWTGDAQKNADKFGEKEALPSILNSFLPSKIVLNKGEEKKINGHTFKFGSITSGDINPDDGQQKIGEITKIDETKENDETKSKEVSVTWIPSALNSEVRSALHQALYNASAIYKLAIKGVLKALNCLPPSAAMAGIYTMVDNTRGVWKAPANVALNYVDSLTETIGDEEQKNLNVPVTGKAINVIRAFRGEGNKVWGARTLDGNSQDWRYVNVRRTMCFLEESVRNAARAYVFEPNDASTWINMKCMIENFLRSVWKRGGLAGATPEEAFEVHVGLGDTMTGDDILEGILRITVLVAISRPAEFIEITFQQQMQKS